jgi:hypothetical protein
VHRKVTDLQKANATQEEDAIRAGGGAPAGFVFTLQARALAIDVQAYLVGAALRRDSRRGVCFDRLQNICVVILSADTR